MSYSESQLLSNRGVCVCGCVYVCARIHICTHTYTYRNYIYRFTFELLPVFHSNFDIMPKLDILQ